MKLIVFIAWYMFSCGVFIALQNNAPGFECNGHLPRSIFKNLELAVLSPMILAADFGAHVVGGSTCSHP